MTGLISLEKWKGGDNFSEIEIECLMKLYSRWYITYSAGLALKWAFKGKHWSVYRNIYKKNLGGMGGGGGRGETCLQTDNDTGQQTLSVFCRSSTGATHADVNVKTTKQRN